MAQPVPQLAPTSVMQRLQCEQVTLPENHVARAYSNPRRPLSGNASLVHANAVATRLMPYVEQAPLSGSASPDRSSTQRLIHVRRDSQDVFETAPTTASNCIANHAARTHEGAKPTDAPCAHPASTPEVIEILDSTDDESHKRIKIGKHMSAKPMVVKQVSSHLRVTPSRVAVPVPAYALFGAPVYEPGSTGQFYDML